jgi:hypothetical protein
MSFPCGGGDDEGLADEVDGIGMCSPFLGVRGGGVPFCLLTLGVPSSLLIGLEWSKIEVEPDDPPLE